MIKLSNLGNYFHLFKRVSRSIWQNQNLFNFTGGRKTDKISRPTLDEYQAIKKRQKTNWSQKKNMLIENEPVNQIQKQYQQQIQTNSHYRCDGCNTFLQFKDKKKYGYINEKVFKQTIDEKKSLIKETYGQRVQSGDAKVINFLHEIEKDSKIEIFSSDKKEGINMKNLENIEVLLQLQQKIDKYEEENQTLKRSKKNRKQLFCYRCYSLKYHNHLPEQYDDQIYEGGLNLDRQFVLEKVFNKHKSYQDNVHFLLVVDALDVFGTLKKELIFKLLSKGCSFSIVINKCDILNQKYLSQSLLHQQVKKLFKSYLFQYQESIRKSVQFNNFSAQDKIDSIKIFFVSSLSRVGVKNIQKFMNQGIRRIQLFGVPNTGKTSLLNKLLNSQKLTSKVPGTTIRVSEFTYRNKIKVFDMPGLHYTDLMYNLISKPSLKSILTWNKFYSPPLMNNQCFIYGGKIQGQGLRIIPFGMGGCCSSDNKWLILNRRQFWKGLPELDKLNIVRHQKILKFKNGRSEDLQISGYGFISFKPGMRNRENFETKIFFYLPEKISYNFRDTVLKEDRIFHNKSGFKKSHQLERIKKQSKAHVDQ